MESQKYDEAAAAAPPPNHKAVSKLTQQAGWKVCGLSPSAPLTLIHHGNPIFHLLINGSLTTGSSPGPSSPRHRLRGCGAARAACSAPRPALPPPTCQLSNCSAWCFSSMVFLMYGLAHVL
jgi:hypothetical protein